MSRHKRRIGKAACNTFAAMKTVNDFNFSNKRVLVRVDFNVPLDKVNLSVTDSTRIKAAKRTIDKILADGGAVILMSHLGRPKEGPADKYSLKNVVSTLSETIGKQVLFAPDCIGEEAKSLSNTLKPGGVLLLENLRFYKEEEKGDAEFARKLSALGDFYVNDAFGTAHRRHASTAVMAENFVGKRCAGFLMADEINNAQRVLTGAKKPYTAITGGAKVSDKILIIEQLLNRVDNLIIGGGMAYTFFKAMGGSIGSSLCEEDRLQNAIDILNSAKEKGVNILLPMDSVIADAFSNEANKSTSPSDQIPDGWMGLDIGPEAAKRFAEIISGSATLLWNGPMGVFEMDSFQNGTKTIAEAVAKATSDGAYSLIGGGDSAAAVNKFGFSNKVSYVSTGGGALLEFLEGKKLPGVELLLVD
jgi:phosphoglycerate kinase